MDCIAWADLHALAAAHALAEEILLRQGAGGADDGQSPLGKSLGEIRLHHRYGGDAQNPCRQKPSFGEIRFVPLLCRPRFQESNRIDRTDSLAIHAQDTFSARCSLPGLIFVLPGRRDGAGSADVFAFATVNTILRNGSFHEQPIG